MPLTPKFRETCHRVATCCAPPPCDKRGDVCAQNAVIEVLLPFRLSGGTGIRSREVYGKKILSSFHPFLLCDGKPRAFRGSIIYRTTYIQAADHAKLHLLSFLLFLKNLMRRSPPLSCQRCWPYWISRVFVLSLKLPIIMKMVRYDLFLFFLRWSTIGDVLMWSTRSHYLPIILSNLCVE